MRRSRLLALSLVAIAAAPACVANSEDGSILITQASQAQSGCALQAAAGEAAITRGQLSSQFPAEYVITAQMHSLITAVAGQELQRTITTESANIDLAFPGSTLFTTAELADMKAQGLTHFKSLFTASISPNQGITDGSFTVTPIGLYDKIYEKAPEARMAGTPFSLQVQATIVVNGTMSGQTVTSKPFLFPITISNTNGLVDVAGTCPLPAGTTLKTGDNCMRPQDAQITCCDSGAGIICPATVATM